MRVTHMRILIQGDFMKVPFGMLLLGATVALAGCGSGGESSGSAPDKPPVIDNATVRGTLVQSPPPRTQSLDTAAVGRAIGQFGQFGSALLDLAGSPKCGIDIHQVEYATVGAAGEPTRASAALMVPTGAAAPCSGKHPLLLYGHGSSEAKALKMGDLRPSAPYSTPSISVAALFAAQGYIVLAPNYAGHDNSPLSYHPHHIAEQNAKDMIDALSAARKALPRLPTPVAENGKLFLSGNSEGGYVTMATHRAMQALGITVTASAPISGNYAESVGFEYALSRPVLFAEGGAPTAQDTLKMMMKITAWQKAYNNLYSNPGEIYSPAYAAAAETLGPATSSIASMVSSGKLPVFLLGNDMPNVASLDPLQRAYYGAPERSLLKTSYMSALVDDVAAIACPATSSSNPLACATTHPVRQAWFKNDLRTWTPTAPMLMCGGHKDEDVAYLNTELTFAYFQAHVLVAGLVSTLDVDSPASAGDPYALAKATFSGARQLLLGAGENPDSSDNYHGFTVFAGCTVASRDFFARF
jgi:hypothetical protein